MYKTQYKGSYSQTYLADMRIVVVKGGTINQFDIMLNKETSWGRAVPSSGQAGASYARFAE